MHRVRVPKQAIRAVRRSGLPDVDKRAIYKLLTQLAALFDVAVMVDLARIAVTATRADAATRALLAEVAS